ncbi:MAG: DNA repair protein RecN [Ruminococcaceae bacterium]|nr:DNA repair protein RecN [Oscillospiraceae bacterium]
MLSSLHIENIAVIRSVDIDMSKGFTVLTGETGAGKSIIIDSINFLMGNKTGKELIRNGEKSALVSALFTDIGKDTAERLDELGLTLDENDELFLQRTLNSDGKSQIKINGRTVPAAILKEAAGLLINIHGQHDNKSLLESKYHIDILDSFSDNGDYLVEYKKYYDKMNEITSNIKSLEISEGEKQRLTEILTFQIKDIDSARLKPGEEEELLVRESVLRNGEHISKQIRFCYKALCSNEKGVTAATLARKSADALNSVSDVLPELKEYAEKLNGFAYEMEEIAVSAKEIAGDISLDPLIELNEVQTRLDVIHKLKRKYGSTVEEILEYRDKRADELDNISRSEDKIEELKREYREVEKKASELCSVISERRKNAAEVLEKQVCECLAFLEMPKVRFKVDISKLDKYSAKGKDDVVFMLSANLGEPLKMLSKIASGGELSRIMLSIKSVLREKESTGTVIFDEVDTGVSGKTSQKIGIKLKQTSESCQVICITHSAQIAALADEHLFISKAENEGRVETRVKNLDYESRIAELARIMGGQEITQVLLSSAKELLDTSKKY